MSILENLQKLVLAIGLASIGMFSDPDVLRFLFLVIAALYTGGVVHVIYRYRTHPPNLHPDQRRRFVFGALAGGSLMVVGFVINVMTRQNESLAPGTPIGFVGLVVILMTIWLLLYYANPPRGK